MLNVCIVAALQFFARNKYSHASDPVHTVQHIHNVCLKACFKFMKCS